MPPQTKRWEGVGEAWWAELNRRHTGRVAPTLTSSKNKGSVEVAV